MISHASEIEPRFDALDCPSRNLCITSSIVPCILPLTTVEAKAKVAGVSLEVDWMQEFEQKVDVLIASSAMSSAIGSGSSVPSVCVLNFIECQMSNKRIETILHLLFVSLLSGLSARR